MNQTFYQKLVAELEENGLFSNMAHDAAVKVMAHKNLEHMAGRWNNEVSGYPANLFSTIWLLAKPVVYAHISEVAPAAWFRPMFAPGSDNMADADKFVKDFWDSVGGIDAGQLTEGSEQQQYSLKHLEAGTGPDVNEDFRGDVINSVTIVQDVPKTAISSVKPFKPFSDINEAVPPEGLLLEVRTEHSEMDRRHPDTLPTEDDLPKTQPLSEGYVAGLQQVHAKLVDNPTVGEDGIVKDNG